MNPDFGAIKLVHIVTSPITAWSFLRGQLRYLSEHGFDVTLVSAPGPELDDVAAREGVRVVSVPMLREPSPIRDAVTLGRLVALLRKIRPHIVHCGTPKASLLGGVAGWMAGVPVRVMTLHGLRADGLSRRSRRIVLSMERMSCRAAERVYCVGESLRSRAIALKIASPEKLRVLCNGTANGIDADRFSRTPEVMRQAGLLRERFKLPAEAPVIGFVGRLVRDKGVAELVAAFKQLKPDFPHLTLLLVGHAEDYDGLGDELRAEMVQDPQIIQTGFLESPSDAYPLMTLLALPTYREGFPYVPMEAASMGLPVVATRVTGCLDAVVDGRTGTLVPPRDPAALARAIRAYLMDAELCRQHGAAGQDRVRQDFRPEPIWESLTDEYAELLRAARLPAVEQASARGRQVERIT